MGVLRYSLFINIITIEFDLLFIIYDSLVSYQSLVALFFIPKKSQVLYLVPLLLFF